jgi:predicted TPR repeat methyltransferase
VREVFEQYSDHYERSLVAELGYCVPARLRQLLDRHFPDHRFRCGIDLGCGTGLGAQAFADRVEVFDGVDLSPKMLELAAGKALFRHLQASTIDTFLISSKEAYDLALATDVLAYLGDLQPIFTELAARMRPLGLFLFSTELWSGNGYKLQSTGRFAHAGDYVAAIAEASGWQLVERRREGLRREKGQWVEGDLWLCRLGPFQNAGGERNSKRRPLAG